MVSDNDTLTAIGDSYSLLRGPAIYQMAVGPVLLPLMITMMAVCFKDKLFNAILVAAFLCVLVTSIVLGIPVAVYLKNLTTKLAQPFVDAQNSSLTLAASYYWCQVMQTVSNRFLLTIPL